jgi:hypothetical protein
MIATRSTADNLGVSRSRDVPQLESDSLNPEGERWPSSPTFAEEKQRLTAAVPAPPANPRATDLLTEATKLYELGWAVFPATGEKHPASRYKKYLRGGRRPDRKTTRRWFLKATFYRRPIIGIAVLLGKPSGGLRVRDFDSGDAYLNWARLFPHLASSLPTTVTARGCHVYFYADSPEMAKAVFGTPPLADQYTIVDGKRVPLTDGEYRGAGIAMAPPSAHPDGGNYAWKFSPWDVGIRSIDPVADGLCPAGLRRRTRPRTPPPGGANSGNETQVTQETQATHLHKQSALSVPAVRAAIRETVPIGPGVRWRSIWALVGRLKAIPLAWTPEQRLAVIRDWFLKARPAITSKDFEETLNEYGDAWANRKYATGMQWPERLAKAAAGPCPREAVDYCVGDGAMRGVMTVCAGLQADVGADGTFILSCRDTARAVGIEYQHAARLLKTLAGWGLLDVIEKGYQLRCDGGASVKNIASTYRWRGSLPSAIEQNAVGGLAKTAG